MEKVTFTEALGLGFIEAQLNDAQPYESYNVRPDARLRGDFNVTEYFVTNGTYIFYLESVVHFDNVNVRVTRNSNYKGKYILSSFDDLLTHSEMKECKFDETTVIAYNKKKLTNKIEVFASEIKRVHSKVIASQNFYQIARKRLEEKGFSVSGYGAYIKLKNLEMKVEICSDKIRTVRITPTSTFDPLELVDLLSEI